MAFPASALRTYGKATLPTVDGWGTDMNIIKDPPKSIFTRKIDKVGSNNDIMEDIDGACDRMCESIKVFARGVNPMVNVNYGNQGIGGGGGSQSKTIQGGTKGGGGKLPIRIMQDGAFRPPIVPQALLMPLSRQPRLATECMTNPQSINYTERASCADVNKKIKAEVINVNLRPNAVYRVEKPIQQHYTAQYIMQEPLAVCGYSGTRTLDWSQKQHLVPTQQIVNQVVGPRNVVTNISNDRIQVDNNRGIQQECQFIQDDITRVSVNPNPSGELRNVDINLDTKRYLQDVDQYELDSKRLKEMNLSNMDEMADLSFNLKNPVYVRADTNKKGEGELVEYIHTPIQLERKGIAESYTTNMGANNMGIDSINNNVTLPKRSERGGFINSGSMPATVDMARSNNMQRMGDIANKKIAFNSSVSQMHEGRFR